jgi:hypothetical protein
MLLKYREGGWPSGGGRALELIPHWPLAQGRGSRAVGLKGAPK